VVNISLEKDWTCVDEKNDSILVSKVQVDYFAKNEKVLKEIATDKKVIQEKRLELVLGNEKEGLVSLEINLDRRLPVSEQVYGVLRDSIIRVKLFPGSPISENSICRQFSVSRTPVRAALQRLSEEGLVDIFPQQGTFVSKIRVDDIKDSHFVRRSLEVAVLRDVGSRWTKETSRTFRDLVEIQAADVRRNDVDAFLASDERFHQAFSVHARKEGVWSVIKAGQDADAAFLLVFWHPTTHAYCSGRASDHSGCARRRRYGEGGSGDDHASG